MVGDFVQEAAGGDFFEDSAGERGGWGGDVGVHRGV